ncbi:hypothetical protein ACF1A5_31450 [Streptomyces sp. NPDC014864]|uniref:hypothetical protein n=1 Tax=Streptomyces sp. NPDC014864 TaxID=3364924 RepID=UPI0036FF57DE
MTIKTRDDLVVRLYRPYVRLKADIRADDQDLDRRFEHIMDAVASPPAPPHRPATAPRRRPPRPTTDTPRTGRRRTCALAAAVAALTTTGGLLQGVLGAVVSLSASTVLACAAIALHHGTPRRRH